MREPQRVFNRDREVSRYRRLVERLHSPRLAMGVIAALTAASGLLASYLLLWAGLASMLLRYPLSVAIAYVAFLFFLWCWLHWERRDHDAHEDAADLALDIADQGSTNAYEPVSAHDSSVPDTGDTGLDLPDGEGAFIGLAIVAAVALFAAIFAAFSIISVAPVLFAELLVDVALAGGLYRHVRGIDRERYWLKTALARTFWRFTGVAALAAAAGWAIAFFVPGADSVGDLLR
ncbi:hypothetical protein [Tahibacter sp.]|uniref:hypothetical protein n=1 Tax=Tahibacter sp. TaxID=2056211 RepID=UPI0028C4AF27|nr:hypothetical protein [Tahibacter sp.]